MRTKVVANPVPVISSLRNYRLKARYLQNFGDYNIVYITILDYIIVYMFLLCSDPPEYEVKSAQASVRRGASQTLECEVHGDQPIGIVWHREGQPSLQFNPR